MSKLKYSIDDVNKLLDELNSVDSNSNTITLGGVVYQLTPVASAGEKTYIDKVASELSTSIKSLSDSTAASLAENNQLAVASSATASEASKHATENSLEVKAMQKSLATMDEDLDRQYRKLKKMQGTISEVVDKDLFLGLFESVTKLASLHPTAKVGNYAYVYDETSSKYILAVKQEEDWNTFSDVYFSDVQTSSVYEGTVSQKTINLTLSVNASIANRNNRDLMKVVNQLVDKVNELQKKVVYLEEAEYDVIPTLSLAPQTVKKDDATDALGLAGLPISLKTNSN